MQRNRDYKDVWQDFYDEAEEEGIPEAERGQYADSRTADYYAALADWAHDRAKEGDRA
jgi:hypothetical protein